MSISASDADDSVSAGELSARYDTFIVDLLGSIAYGELSAFERLATDARHSPSLSDRAVLGKMAVSEFGHYEMMCARLNAMGMDPELAMAPYQRMVDAFHERTRPADWHESLMKAYVVETITEEFYAAIAERLDAPTREAIAQVRTSEEQISVLTSLLKKMLSEDPRLSSRLALWGRRMVGEALTQVQRIGARHSFLVGLRPDATQEQAAGEVSAILSMLTRNHSKRMSQLGLTA
ncbi:ferritin-like fold-containing protein [Arthrobacter antibioticus]|uniref:ferritin-like fold-containing protein n=1 Tax=Arthrobacter sp. H35-MC1 TaxID=3046203 RepID=UPI0024BA7820|nr:ferritin-like fold-containing protein [Arthrobacter sp. H35-MC1]MDJ0317564.1 ferritin-like fold-containing protein [Arthrobacter sp. H35-MC1]